MVLIQLQLQLHMVVVILIVLIIILMQEKILVVLLVVLAVCEKCQRPPAAAGFTEQAYSGKWYEIGKYQTAGGAFFERNCRCTEMNIGKAGTTLYAYQTCIRNGNTVGINATLLPAGDPGEYVEQFGLNKAGYWVIQLDSDTAVEYDCQESAVGLNYCVHIMSRKTTLSQQRIDQLKHYADSLNTHSLPFQLTDQTTCRNTLIQH